MAGNHVRHRGRREVAVVAPVVALLAALTLFIGSPLDAGAVDITSAGPLTKVTTTPDLNCAVDHVGDSKGEFFSDTACGTFVTDGTNLYGPAYVPAGSNATNVTGYTPWTPVSQTGPTGTGSAADPFKVVTKVTGGPFTIVQTDSYVVGQESVATTVEVTSSSTVNAVIYRAGDCYLQDSDAGFGALESGNAPTCKAEPGSANPDRIEQWYPLTPGSNYLVNHYSTVWAAIGSMQPFPNTVQVDFSGEPYDNGGGLSWSKTIAAGSTATFSHLMLFSPLGIQPVTVTKAVSPSTVNPGDPVSYTITLHNPSTASVGISAITDHLPDGFSYVAGSTTGATTADPAVSGQDLTWSGSFSVPGATGGTAGTLTLTFTANAATALGVYTNSASAVGAASQGATVIGATDVAPVTVTGGSTTTLPPPTTAPPTTAPPTTAPPTTAPPTTAPPTTAPPTTAPPTTAPPTTVAPTVTLSPTSMAPTTTRPGQAPPPATAVPATPTYTG